MSRSNRALEALNNHWAVAAIDETERNRAQSIADHRLARRAVGEQISFIEDAEGESLLGRMALAFELVAVEGLSEPGRPDDKDLSLRDQAVAAAFRAFELRRVMSVPKEPLARLFFVLQLSSLAYCGDRWSDLQRWYGEHEDEMKAPSVEGVPWDIMLLYRLFDCWVRLFRKAGRNDLNRVREIIADLRNDQSTYEKSRLQNGSETADLAIALRLTALYNWAKATETMATYMLQSEPSHPFNTLDKHFEAAIEAASAAGDATHEMVMRWLYATARIMVTNSI